MTDAQIRRLERSYRQALARADEAREARDAGLRKAHGADASHSLRDLAALLGVTHQYVAKIIREGS